MSSNNLVDRLIDAMKTEIQKYQLEILQRYPSDLDHDRLTLEWAAVPGMEIAWMVGHSHTHMVPLGLHDGETEMCGYLTNMANDDRFYLIKVGAIDFTMKEVTRDAFGQMGSQPSKYRQSGSNSGFWLKGRNMENVGTIEVVREGTFSNPVYHGRIAPVAGISAMDKAALNVWCSKAITKVAGTLFARCQIEWGDPIRLAA